MPLGHLGGERLDVEPGRRRLTKGNSSSVRAGRRDGLGDAGVLDLDGDLGAVVRDRAGTCPIEAAANASSSNSVK